MKRFLQIAVFLILTGMYLSAQSPKREVRATWLSTVWQLDWPSVKVPAATGTNEATREAARITQKTGLISILNKLQAANFNTVFFQIRGMSDAMYHSHYEPWSQYLSSVRGADPGWDPLAYLVEEAHDRGIEVHAWLNPYRYSTSAESHGNLPDDYAVAHPEWLLDYGNYTKILNPGLPEVRQRISDVVADIITNYDVDGIVFDDYFYVQGITDDMDEEQYQLYNPEGLSRKDWRRNNVNHMVRDVQTRINTIKPYITFGISPAGVAASSPVVAAKYGVDPAPVGSDWQYDGIYSDPLAWLKDGSIDYISPQLYWAIGHATNDFSKLSPWWAKIANHFGRHFYSSNTSTFSITELNNEIAINRNADLNGTTGSVYFRTNNLAQATTNGLKASSYQSPALRAAYGWKVAPEQSLVENLAVAGQNLTWTYDNESVRYSIYAVPKANRNDAGVFAGSKYLLGISYSKNYTLPQSVSALTHDIAVAVYDRFGNEFSPRVLSETGNTLLPAQLIYPANQAEDVVLPALFSWQSTGVDASYVWELSDDAGFTKPITSRETTNSEFYSGLQTNIRENTTYYWRVKSIRPNAPIAVSEVRSFTGTKFKILSPADGAEKVPLTPEISWTDIGDGAFYTLEISNKADFSVINYTTNVQSTTVNVPGGFLATSTTYYARVKAVRGEIQAISERIHFITEDLPVPVPVIISPADGATISGTEIAVTWQEQNSKGFRAELSKDPAFPPRATTVKRTDPFVYNTVFTNLGEGTYYIQVKALNSDGLTEPSGKVMINMLTTSVGDPKASEICYIYTDRQGQVHLIINVQNTTTAHVDIYSVSGVMLQTKSYSLISENNDILLDLNQWPDGVYMLKVSSENFYRTIKIKK